MKICVLSEINKSEKRVSLVPDSVNYLVKKRHEIFIVDGAGKEAGYPNQEYTNSGAKIISNHDVHKADICITISKPKTLSSFKDKQVLISVLGTRSDKKILKDINDKNITAFDMELIPRISRAQRMDVLSSQASIAGYKSALIIANELGIYLPMMMTAAGTIPPAKILILGAGVAGLQAIATARRLGALVSAFDIRLAAGEQIESLGATFIHPNKDVDAESQTGYAKELEESEQIKQRKFLEVHLSNSDGVITTAAIPGKRAPILITNEMIKKMKPGSVIVDVVADSGGNVELNNSGETIIAHGVKIISPVDIQSKMSKVSSDLYSRNVTALIDLLTDNNGNILFDFEDEIINSTCVTNNGQSRNE